jgi:NADPH-dependent glutamate synthase beta subunit-like oxidoreductase
VTVSKPTADQWIEHAIGRGFEAEVIAWVSRFPQVLASYTDGGQNDNPYIYNPKRNQNAFVSPRSLETASNIVRTRKQNDPDAVIAALTGAIGESGARDMQAYIEFADQLKADAVLVNKLRSLNNVTIHTNSQTTEITGDGSIVNGIRFKDRSSGEEHHIALEGVFVQIGLIPNTEFLKGTFELSKFGEIMVDAKGHTNVPGVFAAGDCTTVPFKQIVIAAGDGAKAALSAFDHLIRTPVAA